LINLVVNFYIRISLSRKNHLKTQRAPSAPLTLIVLNKPMGQTNTADASLGKKRANVLGALHYRRLTVFLGLRSFDLP